MSQALLKITGKVQGEKHAIEKFITWCKDGPDHAQVENIEVEWNKTPQSYNDFQTY